MASVIFDAMIDKWARGNIDFDTDTFKRMLVTSAYTENKKTHAFRSDVTNEVSGTGYTAGGASTTATVTLDTVNDRVDIGFGTSTWASSTITARKSVVYKSRGGASSADEIIYCNDFGSDVISSSGTFTANADTVRIQN